MHFAKTSHIVRLNLSTRPLVWKWYVYANFCFIPVLWDIPFITLLTKCVPWSDRISQEQLYRLIISSKKKMAIDSAVQSGKARTSGHFSKYSTATTKYLFSFFVSGNGLTISRPTRSNGWVTFIKYNSFFILGFSRHWHASHLFINFLYPLPFDSKNTFLLFYLSLLFCLSVQIQGFHALLLSLSRPVLSLKL